MSQVSVVKFGGSSFLELADYRKVAAYLSTLAATRSGGVVAVVSGMSGTTGRLYEAALAIDPDLEPQVQDQVLATAEIVGAGFLRAALHAQGCPAMDLSAHQIGIRSDDTATRARILAVDPAPVRAALARHRVVVVAGGQAVDVDGRITMLGRNSSDLTAVAVAAALGVDACEILSDVPGIYTADPYLVPSARLLENVTYAQCAAMSRSGAKVLHWGSVAAAEAHGVKIVCRSMTTDQGSGGSVVGTGSAVGTGSVVGTGSGQTAVVGDTRAQLFLVAASAAPPALAALRATGLEVTLLTDCHRTVLVFPGGQTGLGQALAGAGVAAERVEGLGVVSVVTPDGQTRPRLVPLEEVPATVRALHDARDGAPAAPVREVFSLDRKRRSAHSDLLSGAPTASPGARPTGSAHPSLDEAIGYVRSLAKPSVADLLDRAAGSGQPLVQPRCGVGDHAAMRELLTGLERHAAPDVLTVTIDSHTRLLQFESVRRTLASNPGNLNGYPLVTHGWRRGRELNESVRAPIQVRHGSPDARVLFDASLAAGFTSFEGGGIGYNVPYAKDVPIIDSLRSWQQVDRLAGEATAAGLTIDRELFGTLTAVLTPPAIALAVTLLEAVLAAAQGVRCVSIAYPQGGHPWQDLAALRAIPRLASRYLDVTDGPGGVRVHPVLHQFMGVFPSDRSRARDLITYGGLIAALGGVHKVVTKSPAEARGIPTMTENADGIALTRAGMARAREWFPVDEGAVTAELEAIEREVTELIDPVLERPDPVRSIAAAFDEGTLDMPFGASRFVRSAVMPGRDSDGAIRFVDVGGLPFSAASRRRNDALLAARTGGQGAIDRLLTDVAYFSDSGAVDPLRWLAMPGQRASAAVVGG